VTCETVLAINSSCLAIELWCTGRNAGKYEMMLYTLSYVTSQDMARMGVLKLSDLDGQVMECKLELATGLWRPKVLRDKLYPNTLSTIEKTCLNICENIQPSELY
jgi:hypothetical protein